MSDLAAESFDVDTNHEGSVAWQDLKRRAAFYFVVLASFAPLLVLHFKQLWAFEHYQFFPLLLIAIPVLISHLWVSAPIPRIIRPIWQKSLLLAGLLLLAIAYVAWSPNLAALALAVTAGAILLELYQQGWLSRFLPLWCLFFLLIKLPLNLDIDLIFWLQGLTSTLASRLLDFTGVNHVLAGHIIQTANDKFLVEEACSGIQSLFTLVAAAAIFLTVYRRPWYHCVALVGCAAFWACTINIGRVAGVVIAMQHFGIDISTGTAHQVFGLVLFALAFALLFSSDRLLLFFLESDEVVDIDFEDYPTTDLSATATEEESTEDRSLRLHVQNGSTWIYVIGGGFVLLLVLQLATLALQAESVTVIDPDNPQMITALNENSLPETIGEWERVEFDAESRALTNFMGRNTASWVYRSPRGTATVAIDFPFLGWHELTGCYAALGYDVSAREVLATEDNDKIQSVQAIVAAPDGEVGHLWFSEFLQSGQPLVPAGNSSGTLQYWLSRFQSAFLKQTASLRRDPSSYQVQLLYQSKDPLDEQQATAMRDFHHQTAITLVELIREVTQ
ncbi:Transmembrane exosortase (Exosortase_EpsH) [Rosistilla ulvae]|uniref:Transmembrane exosortase (Exosortase_EpsH) n=1 Tax=Rosistilla ulvae TaxID=1930277 RepID=A0A517M1Y2_9BACT|nr:exosortase U [Rosistilla ulvae]QDS88877.1 Transmembrane exosortase (Exosortase_EpsH) [Rosistilla ulvae]